MSGAKTAVEVDPMPGTAAKIKDAAPFDGDALVEQMREDDVFDAVVMQHGGKRCGPRGDGLRVADILADIKAIPPVMVNRTGIMFLENIGPQYTAEDLERPIKLPAQRDGSQSWPAVVPVRVCMHRRFSRYLVRGQESRTAVRS